MNDSPPRNHAGIISGLTCINISPENSTRRRFARSWRRRTAEHNQIERKCLALLSIAGGRSGASLVPVVANVRFPPCAEVARDRFGDPT